jgi:hypothetical protein
MTTPPRDDRARSRGPLLFAVAVALAIVVALVVVLARSDHRRTGQSGADLGVGLFVPGASRLCQPGQDMVAGTRFLLFFAKSSAAGGGPLVVTVRDAGGRVLSRGTARPRVYGPEPQAGGVILSRELPELSNATVCIANAGSRQVAIWGRASGESGTRLAGPGGVKDVHAVLRLEYRSGERRSWWSVAPDVARRASLVKATFFGAWAFWVAMVALLAICLGSVLYAGRALRA